MVYWCCTLELARFANSGRYTNLHDTLVKLADGRQVKEGAKVHVPIDVVRLWMIRTGMRPILNTLPDLNDASSALQTAMKTTRCINCQWIFSIIVATRVLRHQNEEQFKSHKEENDDNYVLYY
ncbi:hypothetical protein NX059_003377 [Plenodomus lindquistii]|nr:hypothetical protein NX059_003377 [Plenodomus lindquistii]